MTPKGKGAANAGMNSWIGIILIALAILFVGGICGMAAYVGWKLIHPPRKPITMSPEQFGIEQYQEISFSSRGSTLKLHGWYFSARANGYADNGHTLIFAHGYSQNRLEPHLPALALAAKVIGAGYDVLMFDFRNAGMSEGKITTVGYQEQEDVLGAIDYVAKQYPNRGIGLIGFSMGAVSSLLAAGRERRVKAVVADSPFYSLVEYLNENLPNWTGLPRYPFNWLILTLMPLVLRANPRAVSPHESIKRMRDKPILLVHGTADETIPHTNSERLYQLTDRIISQIWLVPDVGHVRSFAARPEEYAQKVIRFLEKAMPPNR